MTTLFPFESVRVRLIVTASDLRSPSNQRRESDLNRPR